ncbi:MAG: hypothetical protein WBK28_00880 [Minisyncoccia bacterium]
MPGPGERIASIAIRDKDPAASEAEPFTFEHEAGNIPDTPVKVAALLRRKYAEIKDVKNIETDDISEEALFVLELQKILEGFYEDHASDIPPEHRYSLNYFISVLEGTQKEVELSPMHVRELMGRVRARFGVPEREDITMLEDGERTKGQAGRKDAHEKLLKGVITSWQKLLVASLEHHYAESFPERIRSTLQEIATEENILNQRTKVSGLAARATRFDRSHFLNFLKALATESIGPLKSKRGVISREEVETLAEYISNRMPEETRVPGAHIAGLLIEGAQQGGGRVPQNALARIITVFAQDVHAVHELSDLEWLSERDSIPASIHVYWNRFSKPQRAEFIERVRATYTNEPFKSRTLPDTSLSEGKANVRKQLKNLCVDLKRLLVSGKKEPSPRQIDQLAALIAVRVEEVYEFRTSPEVSDTAEEAALSTEEEEEKNDVTLESIRQQLSIHQAPSAVLAYVTPIARTLRRETMATVRTFVYDAIRATIIGGRAKSEHITTLQGAIGISFNESDVEALEKVIQSDGVNTNRRGWVLLLRAAISSNDFQKRMRKTT